MTKFKLYLLTPNIDKHSYFLDLITSFSGQLSAKDLLSRDLNFSFNEKVSFSSNSQKELSFDMTEHVMSNNNWLTNIFVSKIHIGSMLLLIDKHGNHHVFSVKNIKIQPSQINTTYSYTCQDTFNYTLSKQNEGYTINNDPSEVGFIGSKTVDWWVSEKIVPECYITDVYVKSSECLYQNYLSQHIITDQTKEITDSIKVCKDAYGDLEKQIITFSCSGSSAAGSLLSLAEQIGYMVCVYEYATIFGNTASLSRYFWLAPNKINNVSPYLYSPLRNIESFSLEQGGESLTTILNVKSHEIGDETISLIPTLSPLFLTYFQTSRWKTDKYKAGFYTDRLNGTIWTNSGEIPTLATINKDYLVIEKGYPVKIPLISFGNSENKLLLDFFSAKFAFSTKDSYTFFYVEEDGIPVIYNNTSFTCQLEISLEDEGSIIVQEHEEIPLRYRGKEVTAYLVLPNIWESSESVLFYQSPSINLYSYIDISEEDYQFAKIADECPWLENKLIDFSYFSDKNIITQKEYQTLNDIVLNSLRIVNGQLLCYSQQYYNALKKKTELLANLENTVESAHAELEASGISPYTQKGSAQELDKFTSFYRDLSNFYNQPLVISGANEIQNDYFNKYFKAQQRFLKNIYKFTQYFNTPVSASTSVSHKYKLELNKDTKNENYISFQPSSIIISCKEATDANIPLYESDVFFNKDKIPLAVVNSRNYQKYYIQQIKPDSFTSVSTLADKQYNTSHRYYLKSSPSNRSFIEKGLEQTYKVNAYIELTAQQLQKYYYWKASTNSDFYIKEEVGYHKIGSSDTILTNTVYLPFNKDGYAQISATSDSVFLPVAYQNPADEDFSGYHRKNTDAIICPYPNKNPYEFALSQNLDFYVNQGYNSSMNHYKDAAGCFESRLKRKQFENEDNIPDRCNYDNYFQYRLATSYIINTEDSTDGSDYNFYVPDIYYKKVSFTAEEESESAIDLSIREGKYFLIKDISDSKVYPSLKEIIPLSLEKEKVSFLEGFTIYEYVDYKPVLFDSTNKEKFWTKSQYVYINDKKFNPLTDEYNYKKFLEICSDLYYLTPETLSYATPEKWDDNLVYFEKLSDNSYQTVLVFNNSLKTATNVYVEHLQTKEWSEWGEKLNELSVKVYLKQYTNEGYVALDYPELITINTSNWTGSQNISLKYNGILYTGSIEYEISKNTEGENISTNGEFWKYYIERDDLPFFQERALLIEEQLTEYWLQAYSASKYCDWFIPATWTQKDQLQENKFFWRLFTSENGLNINTSFIPVVKMVTYGTKTQLPSYQITYDPYYSYLEKGRLASELEPHNDAFKQLAEELLGTELKTNLIRLEPTEATTTYYYVEYGGCKWSNLVNLISNQKIALDFFSGLYGLMFYFSQNFIESTSDTFSRLQKEKETIWKNLHLQFPQVFYESVFEYPNATTSEELYQMASYALKDRTQPQNNYSITILDIYSLKGYNGEELKIGYPILIDPSDYNLNNTTVQKAIDQYLFISDIRYDLRSDSNISVTVNTIKYEDKLIQELAKLIR